MSKKSERQQKKLLENKMDSTESITDFSDSISKLCTEINKKISDGGDGGAYLLGRGDSPTEIPFFISTGSTILDTIIANKEGGGVPVGRVTEIYGEPSTGKSLLANHILANTQKLGGLAVLIDTESATSPDFLRTIGVDLKNLIWINVQTVEKVFETIETIVAKVDTLKPKFVTIVWDSLAATSDSVEMEGEYEASGYGMNKAKMLSKGFRKITQFIAQKKIALVVTNQVRSNIGVMFGEKTSTPGGWALPFYCSLRLKVSRNGYLKEKLERNGKTIEETRGVSAKVTIKKSRIAPPFRECSFNIYFNRGIDDKDSWFEALVARDAISRPTTQKYLLKTADGREFEFKKSEWKNVVKDNNLDDEIRKLVIDSHIVKYDAFEPDAEPEFPDQVDVEEVVDAPVVEQDIIVNPED